MNIHCIGTQDFRLAHFAILLKTQGNNVTGSCDDTFSFRLPKLEYGCLPYSLDNISNVLNKVIVGMNVADSNIEIEEARRLSIPILSIDDLILEYTRNQQRVVVLGNPIHTVSSLVIAILNLANIKPDYILRANSTLIDSHVRLKDSNIIIIESSLEKEIIFLDKPAQYTPYNHHIGLICDDNNFCNYSKKQLEEFSSSTPRGGILIHHENIECTFSKVNSDVKILSYKDHENCLISNGMKYLVLPTGVRILCTEAITPHNVEAARVLVKNFAINSDEYYSLLYQLVSKERS